MGVREVGPLGDLVFLGPGIDLAAPVQGIRPLGGGLEATGPEFMEDVAMVGHEVLEAVTGDEEEAGALGAPLPASEVADRRMDGAQEVPGDVGQDVGMREADGHLGFLRIGSKRLPIQRMTLVHIEFP